MASLWFQWLIAVVVNFKWFGRAESQCRWLGPCWVLVHMFRVWILRGRIDCPILNREMNSFLSFCAFLFSKGGNSEHAIIIHIRQSKARRLCHLNPKFVSWLYINVSTICQLAREAVSDKFCTWPDYQNLLKNRFFGENRKTQIQHEFVQIRVEFVHIRA